MSFSSEAHLNGITVKVLVRAEWLVNWSGVEYTWEVQYKPIMWLPFVPEETYPISKPTL